MAARRPAGTGTRALRALSDARVPHVVRAYAHRRDSDLGYGLEAAQALGVEPGRVLKTLVTTVDGELTVALVPVDAVLDLKALAAAVGGKRAALADRALAERATGYVIGAISPLGQRVTLPTVIDESAATFDSVLVSAGRRGVDVELAPADLVRLIGAVLAGISRRRETC